MRSPFNWRFTPLFAVLLLAGCASTDNIAPQSTLMDTQSLQLAQPKVSSLAVSPQWWRALKDPQLDALMTQTLQNSPTLRQAAARVREAQSVVGEANAANGPNLDLNASTQRQRVPQNVNMGLGYPHKPIYSSSNSLGLNLAYEFDWWGKYRNQVNAAKAQVNAARAEQEQAALTLNRCWKPSPPVSTCRSTRPALSSPPRSSVTPPACCCWCRSAICSNAAA